MTAKEAKDLKEGLDYWVKHGGKFVKARLVSCIKYEPMGARVNYAFRGRVGRARTSYVFYKHDTQRHITLRSARNISKACKEQPQEAKK